MSSLRVCDGMVSGMLGANSIRRVLGAVLLTMLCLATSISAFALTGTTTSLTSGVNPSTIAQSTTLTATVKPTAAAGTVTFKDGSTTLGTGTLSSGVAALSVSFSAAGSHTLTAVYGGSTSYATSASTSLVQTVKVKTTTTVLKSGTNPSQLGQGTTLTATVTPTSATGTATFKDGTTTLGTGTLNSGVATYSATFSATGSHSLTVVYNGDASDASSTSSVVTQTVNPRATTTTVASSVNPSQVAQSTTLTAKVTPATATGTVTFKDGTITLGTGTLSSGSATYTATFNVTGSHSLTASYAGDLSDAASTSTAVTQTVNVKTTATVLTSSVNPNQLGQSTTLTAAVTPATATGIVTFKDGTTTLGTGTVSSGVATYAATFSTKGSHSLTAVYGGDSNDASSTSSAVTQTVNIKTTTTSLISGVNPSQLGQSTTLTATVMPATATGTVTFKDGATALGTGTLSSGVATYSATFGTKGSHSLTAVYGGDASDAASTSIGVTQSVNLKTTAAALTSNVNPTQPGQSTTLTATVTPATATGTVTFNDGSTTLGTGIVNSGVATYAASFGAAGVHNLTAIYSGDSVYATSASSALTQTVNAIATATVLRSSVNSVQIGQGTTLTATVSPATATGVVSFKDGATTLGTGTLSSGVLTYVATFSTVGTHVLTAVYGGDSASATSTSNAVNQTVTLLSPTATSLIPSVNPASAGSSLTLVATVTGNSPTGTVQFRDGAASIGGPVTLVSGQASATFVLGTAGGHSYSAAYSGDSTNGDSKGMVSVNVTGSASTTTLLTSTASATPSTPVTFTATVAGSNPTGTLTFRDGAAVLQSMLLTGGTATWAQTLNNGLHSVTASYSGDATNASSSSVQALVQVSADGSVQPPGGPLQVNYEYDAQGNLTKATDANSAVTQTVYDSLSRGIQITQPVPASGVAAPVIGMAYDLQDRLIAVTDPRALTTSYTTDGLGNTTAQTSPDTGATTRTFYDDGSLKTERDARGRTATYAYDALGRLQTVDYDSGIGASFTYDQGVNGIGHLTGISDESGSSSYVYDGLGRVLTKVQTVGPTGKVFTVGYQWGSSGSASGKLQAITYPSGAGVTYGYDTAGRVNSVTVTGADGLVTQVLGGLSYNAINQPQSWVWGTGLVYQRSYDGYGRLTSYPLGNPAGTGIAAGVTRTLAFDAAGRIVGYSHTTPANLDQFFGYDGLGRLISATVSGGGTFGYAYDATGNRTQTTINGAVYASPASSTSNWYTSVSNAAGTAAQGYDVAGHLTSDATGIYTYSPRGRLSSSLISGNSFSYLYNALDQRVYKRGSSIVLNTGVAYYVYDEAGHLAGEYDANGKAIYETVYLNDLPVAVLTQPTLGQTTVSYIYADHLNTARVIVRPTDQAILWSWGGSEPFGQTQANSNPSGLGVFVYNPRMPGQVADAESGWFYNWHRDYNPALGRYVQSDPIGLGGGIDTYAYALESPLMLADPSGLQVTMPDPGGGGGVGGNGCDCDELKKNILRKYGLLLAELRAYDPVGDGAGGFKMRYGSGVTKPGGHFKEINDLRRGLRKDITKYSQNCKDGNGGGGIPRSIVEAANRPVAVPVSPAAGAPEGNGGGSASDALLQMGIIGAGVGVAAFPPLAIPIGIGAAAASN